MLAGAADLLLPLNSCVRLLLSAIGCFVEEQTRNSIYYVMQSACQKTTEWLHLSAFYSSRGSAGDFNSPFKSTNRTETDKWVSLARERKAPGLRENRLALAHKSIQIRADKRGRTDNGDYGISAEMEGLQHSSRSIPQKRQSLPLRV